MTPRLSQLNDGTWTTKSPKRKYPKMLESIVDKSNFRPNVNDARDLLSADKIGSSNIKMLYDFDDGRVNGPNHAWMRNRMDITEIDAQIEKMSKEAQQMVKKAGKKAAEIAAQNRAEIEQLQAVKQQGNGGGENIT